MHFFNIFSEGLMLFLKNKELYCMHICICVLLFMNWSCCTLCKESDDIYDQNVAVPKGECTIY